MIACSSPQHKEFAMTSLDDSGTLAPGASPASNAWCDLLLKHLEELAVTAWYLVADGDLVEEVFLRTAAQLDTISFDDAYPHLACHRVRSMVISQAIALLAEVRAREKEAGIAQPILFGTLPDLPRVAFVLRLVIRAPEAEVARLLDVAPAEVQPLVVRAIQHIGANEQHSVAAGHAETWRSPNSESCLTNS
jgi:DNA-directed RNA polymerase specialized sigma24 family protein